MTDAQREAVARKLCEQSTGNGLLYDLLADLGGSAEEYLRRADELIAAYEAAAKEDDRG